MMAEEKKQRRIDRIDGRTVLFLTLCACIVTFFATSFLGHGIFTFWIFLILCWFGLYKQALGCFAVYLVAIVWLMIETKYQISIPSPLLLSMIYKLLLPAMPAYLLAKIPSGKLTASLRKMPIPTRIQRLPDGYQTVLGENGSTLSGGERQRISIARALLKDAQIILLDEATASLDPENEVLIQRAIAKLVEGKTVIMIAHRLRTVVDADQIIVLDNGKLVECGTHDELMKKKGLYHKLFYIQQESLGWAV